MSRILRKVFITDVELIEAAERLLKEASANLRYAGARRANRYVRRSLKSVQGAKNHAHGALLRRQWAERDAALSQKARKLTKEIK